MPVGVSHLELAIPKRVPRIGRIDAQMKLTVGPTSITGTVRAAGVATRRATGLPRLLMAYTARPLGVASKATVGSPAAVQPVVATVRAKGRTSRRAVGKPRVTATGPGVPWVVMAKGLGRKST